jgi:hypothetical protein
MRVHVLLLGLGMVGGAVGAACGGGPETTTFGPPNGLVKVSAPQPTTSGGSSGSSSGGGSGSSSGSSSGGSSGAAGDGGGGGEGGSSGACAVSWKTTVFPYFESTGPGTCGSQACHGGTDSPTIVDGDPATTFTNLTKYTINGLNYIATGNTTPADSAIECNIGITTPACGIAQMPEAPGTLDAAAKTNITTWLACGAPEN